MKSKEQQHRKIMRPAQHFRKNIVQTCLFQVVYCRVARGMLHIDRLTFAVLLCRIHLRGLTHEPHLDAEFQHFLRGKEGLINNTDLPGKSVIFFQID